MWESEKAQKELGPELGYIEIFADGTYASNGLARRSPLRLVDRNGRWETADPSMTPSGKWSVEFRGEGFTYMTIRKRGRNLVLHHSIDARNNYRVDYIKRETLDSK